MYKVWIRTQDSLQSIIIDGPGARALINALEHMLKENELDYCVPDLGYDATVYYIPVLLNTPISPAINLN